ncbi:MAG: hypothetical protein IPM91_04630 [Bacteroidetes bacterium]|nr:hypothetical protein [Bacteroidota bacterium]
MPVTTSNTLWSILMGNMPLGQWVPIQTLYEIVEANYGEMLIEEDLSPVTPTNNEPTWHRNLRNVFQNKTATGDLLYDGNANYRIDRPTVWRMVKEAVNNLVGEITYRQIKDYINEHWENVNSGTITAQIIVLSVNHESRTHYPENIHPRQTNGKSPYDFLFNVGRGRVVKYNIEEHGNWEIYLNEENKPQIRLFEDPHQKIIYTPADIIWIKNVTNTELGEAYLNVGSRYSFFYSYCNPC